MLIPLLSVISLLPVPRQQPVPQPQPQLCLRTAIANPFDTTCPQFRHHMSAIAPGTQPEVYPPRQKNPSLSSACTQPAFSAFFLPDKKLLAKIFFIDYGMRQRRGFPIRRHGFGT